MTAGKTEIRLIRHSAEKCRHKYSSASDKGPDFLRPAAFVHIIERGGHKPVSAQVRIHIHNVSFNPLLPESTVMIHDIPRIVQIQPRSRNILHCPPVFPVKKDSCLRMVDCSVQQMFQPRQTSPHFRHFTENPGIASVFMIQHGAVEFLI